MLQQREFREGTTPVYAISSDFCRIFAEDMNGLYLLSWLLTADPKKAEECFVSGLGDCVEDNRVFKEWARSWARRAIVRNAIRALRPSPEHDGTVPAMVPVAGRDLAVDGKLALGAILGLDKFERFVLVLSVLERYSDQDCRAMLGCSRQELVWARSRALEQVAAVSADYALNAASEEFPDAPEWMGKSA